MSYDSGNSLKKLHFLRHSLNGQFINVTNSFSATLRDLRAHVSTCLAYLQAYLPKCLACLRVHVLSCSRTCVSYVHTCIHANMLCMPTCSHVIIPNNKNKLVFNDMFSFGIWYFFFVFFLWNKTACEKSRTNRNVSRYIYFENSVVHSFISSFCLPLAGAVTNFLQLSTQTLFEQNIESYF